MSTQLEQRREPRLRASSEPDAGPAGKRAGEGLYLVGRPKMRHFLNYARYHGIDPPSDDDLIEEWREAQEQVKRLKKTEADAADKPVFASIPVDRFYEPLLKEFLQDPLVQNGFNTVPTEVAMVNLDSLVVYQKHIDLTFVRELQRRLGTRPSRERIFRTCLGLDRHLPDAEWARLDDDSFVFTSTSNDMRFLGAMRLKPEHIQDYAHPGMLVGVVGLAVGFGSNFLNAIAAEGRLVLNNGSHRAYALRELGITQVPCIVQHVSSRDELEYVATNDVRRNPDAYLKEPRPPMLKDYFDPKLRRILPVRREHRQVRVKYSINEHYVPAL